MQFVDFVAEANEYGEEYVKAFSKSLYKGWYILGEEVEAFENEFSAYLGTSHTIGVANGLDAIQIALRAIGVGQGDEVITTPLSAMATTLAIMAVGAKPIFVDIKEDGIIDESLVEKAITKSTKAILPVHLYGNAANLEILQRIAQSYKIHLIEDAAQAHGSTYNAKKLGTFGSIGCFSFYPTKNLGAIGDAGAIVTSDEELASRCKQMRDYGQAHKYEHVVYGLNSRLDEIHASILRVKLKHLDKMNKRRIENANYLTKNINNSEIGVVKNIPSAVSNYHQFVIRSKKRNELQSSLLTLGIPSLVHYPILIPDQKLFEGKYKDLELPIARTFVRETLSIPCGPYLESRDLVSIVKALNSFS